MSNYFMGIDVGTGSARVGIFDNSGHLLGSDKHDISLYRDAGNQVEQSSNEIWLAICKASKGAIKSAAIEPHLIKGIGFDATCSLVVLGRDGIPLAVGPSENPERNVIVWMDHRAIDQADRINATNHPVLQYVGGKISPEMETPKLLWLKENRPKIYRSTWQFMDLVDFLTWRATGALDRSTCTVTCKWTYLSHEKRWDETYFESIGLADHVEDNFSRIGTKVVEPGTPLAQGLTHKAAEELGLIAGTAVGAGLIDAHAGGFGTVCANGSAAITDTLCYVFGTSSCTMTTTEKPIFIPGVWGPYYSAMVPGTWLNEGGQSAAGAAIAQLLSFHPASTEANVDAIRAGKSLPDWLAELATAKTVSLSSTVDLARNIHIVPEFLGNRAPHADPNTRAVIAGIGMESDLDNLIAIYVAGICGIGYGLRQIIHAQADAEAHINNIIISGGAGRSPLVRQLLADATGVGVSMPSTNEPVLLGSAIIGAMATGLFDDVMKVMTTMSGVSEHHYSTEGQIKRQHDQRFEMFLKFQNLAREAATNSDIDSNVGE